MHRLYYIHDPMCSWCYGFAQSWRRLRESLPAEVTVIRLLGGLAADNEAPMSTAMRRQVHDNWYRIEQHIPGVRFNHDFWRRCTPRRSTWPACRAVIAARQQGQQYDEAMTRAIQQAYYQQARNPSVTDTLLQLASEIGLDTRVFEAALHSERTQNTLQQEMSLASELGVYSYPDLRLWSDSDVDDETVKAIDIDYRDAATMLTQIKAWLAR